MKLKIKLVYKDKVEPTSVLEVDSENPQKVDEFIATAELDIARLLNGVSGIKGIYISADE